MNASKAGKVCETQKMRSEVHPVKFDNKNDATNTEDKQRKKNSTHHPPGELERSIKSPKKTKPTSPKPLPDRIRLMYDKRHLKNYSEKQKQIHQKRKREFKNKVGWQPRQRSHRHRHQAVREQQLVNYMNGMPLEYECESD